MIFDTKSKKTQKSKKAQSKKKKTPKEKSSWKKEWHASPAYKSWQEAVTPKGQAIPQDAEAQAKFVELRNHAFRERDAIKARFSKANDPQDSAGSPVESASAEQSTEESKEEQQPGAQKGSGKKTLKLKSYTAGGTVKDGKYRNSGRKAPKLELGSQ
jgi:hypothetical protein